MGIVVAVVALHGMDHLVGFTMLVQQIAAKLEVSSVHLTVHRLADVMNQPGSLRNRGVGAELRCHVVAEPCDLHRVLERVLAVRGAELQSSQKLEELGVEIRNPDLERGGLTVGQQLLLHLSLDLGYQLLNAAGVDAPILDQLGQRQSRDLTSHRFEAREDHRLGRVVNDQIDTCRLFESSDVAALSTDDSALHLVRRQIDDRHRTLDYVLRRDPLDGHRNHAARLLLGLLVRLVLDALDQIGRIHASLVLHRPQELGLGLIDRETGDLL